MSKIAIIYWTGTGNTLEMARAIEKGAKEAGADVDVFEVESFGGVERLKEYDGLMFGCPAMGDEVLEEGGSSPSSQRPRAICRACLSHSSAPTAGAAAPGWSPGLSARAMRAPSS